MKKNIDYKLRRSKRKTLSLEVTRDLAVIVRAPLRANPAEIDRFVSSHVEWITRKLDMQQRRQLAHPEPTSTEAEWLRTAAKAHIPARVAYWSDLTGLVPAGITITSARKRFGSCSPKNRLNFSWRLMTYPAEAIDYVVVHELCHLRHRNHGPEFYRLVAAFLPDYKARQAMLKE